MYHTMSIELMTSDRKLKASREGSKYNVPHKVDVFRPLHYGSPIARVQGSGFRDQGLGFRVQGFLVHGQGFRAQRPLWQGAGYGVCQTIKQESTQPESKKVLNQKARKFETRNQKSSKLESTKPETKKELNQKARRGHLRELSLADTHTHTHTCSRTICCMPLQSASLAPVDTYLLSGIAVSFSCLLLLLLLLLLYSRYRS